MKADERIICKKPMAHKPEFEGKHHCNHCAREISEGSAICGKMASGKTTLADWFAEHHGFLKISLAAKVKDVAKDLFGMTHKDRRLLQQIGMKMREIKEDVWIDYLVNLQVDEGENLIVDDVRFINEAEKLKSAGWTLIRINIDDELQCLPIQTTGKSIGIVALILLKPK